MEKRGISPLVATVLIIGFTIVIASMVMIWGGDIFNKYKIQTETESMTQLTCATKLNLNIQEACDLGDSIRVRLENLGDQEINSFIYRAISPSGAAIDIKNEKLSPFGVSLFYLDYFTVDNMYTKPNKIEILPRILIDGKEQTCPGTSKEIKPCYTLPSLEDPSLKDWTITAEKSGLLEGAINILNQYGIAIDDKIGIYASSNNGISIESKEFVIPDGIKSFEVRFLNDGEEFSYSLTVDGQDNWISDPNTNILTQQIFLQNYGGNAKLKINKPSGGFIAITNLAYLF